MATFVPIADGSEVEIVYTLDSKVISTSLWFTFDNPPYTTADLQGLADGVYGWCTSELLPYLSQDLQLAAVEAFDRTADPPPAVMVAGPPVNGGVSESSYSANVAVRMNFRTPLNMRIRMNCNFIPGVPNSAVELNTIVQPYLGRYWDAYVNLIDAARLFSPVFNWRWVVTSRILHGFPRATRLWGECIGPVRQSEIRLGQRRKRLP